MKNRNSNKLILVGVIGLFFTSCLWPGKNWPSKTIHYTYFVDKKESKRNDIILLAQKDSLSIYAEVSLPQWYMLNDIKEKSKEYDSILNLERENCKLNIKVYTNNKGTVILDSFDIQAFDTQQKNTDNIKFTEYCKRKEWDIICYKTKDALLDSLKVITYDKLVSSQLIVSQSAMSPTFFDTKKIYVKIKLKLNYNNLNFDLNYSDTLNRIDETKEFFVHP